MMKSIAAALLAATLLGGNAAAAADWTVDPASSTLGGMSAAVS